MKNNEWRNYLLCVLAVGFLVVAAVWLPVLVLDWMDGQIQKDYVLANRQGIDYAASTLYSNNLNNRLNVIAGDFAQGKQYDIISSELDLEEAQLEEVLGHIQEQTIYNLYCSFLNLLRGRYLADYELVNCANLVMYDGDSINGTPLLCQYYELKLLDFRLRFLVDATDTAIYYMEIYNEASESLCMGDLVLTEDLFGTLDWFDGTGQIIDNDGLGLYADADYDGLLQFVYYAYEENIGYYGISAEDYGSEDVMEREAVDRFLEENGVHLYRMVKNYSPYYYENGFLVDLYNHSYQQRNEDSWSGRLAFESGDLTFCIHYAQLEEDVPYYGICAGIRELEELLPPDFRGEKITRTGNFVEE